MTLDQLSNLVKDPKLFGILIVRPFGLLLQWLYSIVQNYGIAVILFALLVKLVCIPLTIKSKKSMLAMSAMNAELQQLQKKYANNRVKLNEEMQKLYEKHGVSPMSGCLPNLIPLPIMMGLYYAVQQPLQYIVGLSRETVIALAQMIGLDQFAGANYTVQIKIAEKLNAFVDGSGHFSDAVTNCLQSGETIFPLDFHFFGLNLADTPSISHPSIIWIIPILSGLTAFLSSYIMQKMQGTQNSAAAGQMKMLNFMMPLMSLYFAFILPGAIGIYWIFNNVFTCVQEIILTKTLRGKQEAKQAADVSVEVLEIGKKGFLGIGATPARVRVTYEAPDIPAAKPEVKREERKPAPKAEPKQEKPAVKAEKPAPKQEKPAEKPQKLSITTDDNTPRLVKAAPADFVPEKLEFERPPRRERSDRPRRDRGDRNGRDRRPRRPREDRPITPSVPKERELIPVSEAGMQQAEKLATDFVTGLLAKMGVEGQVKTLPQVECDQLRLEISGPDMGPIIGRRGDTLDAIQYLGSLVLNNALDEHVRLSVDTENYREKRAESLERLARKMAMKVVKAHRSMTLEPMNPYERRIIHAALQDFNGVTTYSTGTEPGRRVVIAPDNSYRNRDRG